MFYVSNKVLNSIYAVKRSFLRLVIDKLSDLRRDYIFFISYDVLMLLRSRIVLMFT